MAKNGFTGPNQNSFCVWYLNTSHFSKNNKIIWLEKLKKHIWEGVPSCSLAFLKLKSALLKKILCPSHSSIYYYCNLLFFFVSVGNISSLTQGYACVWSFPLMITMFIKIVRWTQLFGLISNWRVVIYWWAWRSWELSSLMPVLIDAISLQ